MIGHEDEASRLAVGADMREKRCLSFVATISWSSEKVTERVRNRRKANWIGQKSPQQLDAETGAS